MPVTRPFHRESTRLPMSVRSSLVLAAVVTVAATACSSPSASTTASPTPAPAAPAAPASGSAGTGNAAKTSTWDGVYTTAQAHRGATLFAHTCDKCHGPTAVGSADDGGRLVGKDFFDKYEGVTLDQLFNAIYTLMPLDNPRTLPLKDVADITAYLLELNKMPAGPSPLIDDPGQLRKLTITSSKP
jgi:mono/diheme cytochrome c family protein